MDRDSRHQIAEQLGVDLNGAWDDAVLNSNYDLGLDEHPRRSPSVTIEAEAAIIIGMDGEGIQARSHGTFRTLNPTARNHTWREVLASVVTEFRIPVRKKAGTPTVEEFEAAIYEWVAEKTMEKMPSKEVKEIEKFLAEQPEISERLQRAGFGPSAMKLAASGIFKLAERGGFGTYITAVKAAAFLNERVGTNLAMRSVTTGLKSVIRGVNAVLWAWLVKDVLDLVFGPSRGRLIGVISEIHQFYLFKRLEGERP